MLHIPILRHGEPYESIDQVEIVHHATGEAVAHVSQANSGMIVRDINRMADDALERFTISDLLAMCRKAADLFMNATLPIGGDAQSFDDYVEHLSATTAMPVAYCKSNAEKIQRVLVEMDQVLAGLTRGLDLDLLDRGFGTQEGRTLSFYREGRVFGAVLPSNSPGVHGLWLPAIALKTPVVLKPGREEPWTPYRIIEALSAAGVPREAFGFYPTNHAGASELLRLTHRSMLFGDASTTQPWQGDPRVELHGPGYSKVILGDDTADDWEQYLDLMEASVFANCGRSCVNASGVWTPRHGREIAQALAERLARVKALPASDPNASVAAFANPKFADLIASVIENDLRIAGATDVTAQARGSGPLHTADGCSYLLPTIVWCEDREHPLANREFLFPYASVVECPTAGMPSAIGKTLIVSAITDNEAFKRSLLNAPNIDRLNLGPIPTWKISWDQPHEGNLFEHLYRQRALQIEPAA